ncbi:MAG TPA: CBASS cGAMP-activated phospholipase [Myxococcota bacterium]|nr:CBASS cGAMP-activated phospholipase [Myxococcota bacterium]
MRRVLAIDGGGIKGVWPASFLACIEKQVDARVGEFFDLIVGTSTGGIIALGLASGFSAQEILDFYVEHGPAIFAAPKQLHRRIARGAAKHLPLGLGQLGWFAARVGGPAYDETVLRNALELTFKDKILGACDRRVVVPALSLQTGAVVLRKTPHHEKLTTDWSMSLVDVAMETTAAPTYFPAHRSSGGMLVVDGGTWANNPAGVAAVEAVGVLGWDRGDTLLLSLGCTTTPLDARALQSGRGGIWAWRRTLPVISAAQESGALGTAKTLLGESNVKRCSPVVPPKHFEMDDTSQIERLHDLGVEYARQEVGDLKQRFFNSKAEPFEAPLDQRSR